MTILERDISFCGPISVDFFDWDNQDYFTVEPFTKLNNEFKVETSDPSLIATNNIGVWVYFEDYPNDA